MVGKIGILAAAIVLWAAPALAQDERFDVSGNIAGVFSKQSTGNGITQSATDGGNIFASIRMKIAPKHSFLFNFGRATNSQIFQTAFVAHVASHITEYSGAYMFSPFQKGRFEPFLLAGGGVLVFNPQSTWVDLPPINGAPDNVQASLGAAKQTMPAFLYGGGVDYKVPYGRWFSLRLQYRGFFYSNPDFKVTTATSTVTFFTGTKGHMAEPSIGLVFRF